MRSIIDMTEMLSEALQKILGVMQLGGEAGGGIFLLNEETGELQLATLSGLPPEFIERDATVRLDKCLCGRAVETGEIIDTTRKDVWPGRPDWVEPHGHLLVPLKSKSRVLGVMFLYLPAPHRLSDLQTQLLSALCDQIGLSIENAQLHERLEVYARNLELLYEEGRQFSSSLVPQEVLFQVVGRCAQIFEADACLVHLVEGSLLTMRAGHYRDKTEHAETERLLWATPCHVGEGLIGQVAATGEPMLSTEAGLAQALPPEKIGDWRSRKWLLMPLRTQDRILGVLTLITHNDRRHFFEHGVALVQEIANQAAAALENARLYQQAHRRLEQVTLIQAVALAGAVGRPFDDIVADATQRLSRLWDSHHLGFLFANEIGILQLHPSYSGASEARRNTPFRPGEGIVGWALETGKPIVVPDVRQDPRYSADCPLTRSEMAAPLLVGDRVIGVLNVESTHLNAFSAEDLHLLSTLAGQLAIILDNAQTHRELAEQAQQLESIYKELAETDRLRDEIVQNISHELRTPLTFLKGYVELILDGAFGSLPPALRKPLETVSQKTGIVARLVDRIVNLQTVCRETLSVEPLRLADLVQEATNHVKPHAERSGIAVELELPSSLPQVAGDRRMLAEALDNLLNNAIKFSPQGGRVRVSVHVEREVVHLEVADSGIGIPSDKLPKVFNRFYQVDGTTKRRFGGVGVGLALVQRIAQAHGGQVWAESKGLNRGSIFHLALPTVSVS